MLFGFFPSPQLTHLYKQHKPNAIYKYIYICGRRSGSNGCSRYVLKMGNGHPGYKPERPASTAVHLAELQTALQLYPFRPRWTWRALSLILVVRIVYVLFYNSTLGILNNKKNRGIWARCVVNRRSFCFHFGGAECVLFSILAQ